TPIALLPTPNVNCTGGKSSRKRRRVTEKRKSLRAASIPTNFLPRPWSREKCPAFFSSEKSTTSPASSAASISSGPGRPDFVPDKRCEAIGNWRLAICDLKQRAIEFQLQILQITNYQSQILNLRAFLHEEPAREDFGGLVQ